MSLALQENPELNLFEVELSGKISKEDYQRFVPLAEKLIRERGKLRLLVRMQDFDGWTLGSLWEDFKFDAKHFRDIERIAFVGDEAWEKGMSKLCKAFTTAAIRFFNPD